MGQGRVQRKLLRNPHTTVLRVTLPTVASNWLRFHPYDKKGHHAITFKLPQYILERMISTWQAKRWIQNHFIFVSVCLWKYKTGEKIAIKCQHKIQVERNCTCWKTAKAHILGVDVRGHVRTHDQFQSGRLSTSYPLRRDGFRISIASNPHFPSATFFCVLWTL